MTDERALEIMDLLLAHLENPENQMAEFRIPMPERDRAQLLARDALKDKIEARACIEMGHNAPTTFNEVMWLRKLKTSVFYGTFDIRVERNGTRVRPDVETAVQRAMFDAIEETTARFIYSVQKENCMLTDRVKKLGHENKDLRKLAMEHENGLTAGSNLPFGSSVQHVAYDSTVASVRVPIALTPDTSSETTNAIVKKLGELSRIDIILLCRRGGKVRESEAIATVVCAIHRLKELQQLVDQAERAENDDPLPAILLPGTTKEYACPRCKMAFPDIGGAHEVYDESETPDYCPYCGQHVIYPEEGEVHAD